MPAGRNCYRFHFIQKETEAQRGEALCPGLPSEKMVHSTSGVSRPCLESRLLFFLRSWGVMGDYKPPEANGMGMETIWGWSLGGHRGSTLDISLCTAPWAPIFELTALLSSQRLFAVLSLHLPPPYPIPRPFTSPSWAATELLICTGLPLWPQIHPFQPNRCSVLSWVSWCPATASVGFLASHPKAPESGCQPTLSLSHGPCLLLSLVSSGTTTLAFSTPCSFWAHPALSYLHVSAWTQVHSLECSPAFLPIETQIKHPPLSVCSPCWAHLFLLLDQEPWGWRYGCLWDFCIQCT